MSDRMWVAGVKANGAPWHKAFTQKPEFHAYHYSEYVLASETNARIKALEEENARHLAEIDRLRLALSSAHAEGMEEAARIVEEEDEMPGVCPPHVVEAMERIGPIENARAAVRTAKHSIAAAIRRAKESKT